MLRPILIRSVAVGLAGLATASCGVVESDPQRFETLARRIADIPLDSARSPQPARTAAELGLRPALPSGPARPGDLRVEIMDPHDLWDARDPGLGQAVATAVSTAAAGAVVEAVSGAISEVGARQADLPPLRPAIPRPAVRKPAVQDTVHSSVQARAVIQLGAYSSEAAARSAWTTISLGGARDALKGLSPTFEPVEVNGRPLTRLKVSAPADVAVAICRAAQVNDPWCARRS